LAKLFYSAVIRILSSNFNQAEKEKSKPEPAAGAGAKPGKGPAEEEISPNEYFKLRFILNCMEKNSVPI
jgi:hypothetical protein